MNRHYYLHRISHEWEISYPLFNMKEIGYLTIGWSRYQDSDLMSLCRSGGINAFNRFMEEHGNTSRARWGLWYFSQFAPGDYVVVPLYGKEFAICEVTGFPDSILSLSGNRFSFENGISASVHKDGLVRTDGHPYDIGFIVAIKVLNRIPREYAPKDLISRMKIRQTNARADNLSNAIEEALKASGPVDIHEKILTAAEDSMKEIIGRYITPDNLESTVVWYMKKKGADNVWIPAKNEPGKENGADADVIAEFIDLGLVFLIQAKNHKNTTGDWAVTQIKEYSLQKQDNRDGLVYIPWVISTADDFTPEAKKSAEASGVRLINGDTFIRMILNVGLDGMEDIKKATR